MEEALERDNFMSPEEAKEWGHIDEIVENRAQRSRTTVKEALVARVQPPRSSGKRRGHFEPL